MNQPDRGYKSQTFTRPAVSDVFWLHVCESKDSADAQIYSIRMSRLIGFSTAGYEKLDAFLAR
jgi:hypothetical protein